MPDLLVLAAHPYPLSLCGSACVRVAPGCGQDPNRKDPESYASQEEEGHGAHRLQIQAGAANPALPVGPALGQHGVNIMEFCKAYNAATESQRGWVIPVEITVYEDRSFTFITKYAAGRQDDPQGRGRGEGLRRAAQDQGREDHARPGPARSPPPRCPTLNANDLDQAEKIIAGTARSMGVTVEG